MNLTEMTRNKFHFWESNRKSEIEREIICKSFYWFLFPIFSVEGKAKMATILDQKNYLEELNRHLK